MRWESMTRVSPRAFCHTPSSWAMSQMSTRASLRVKVKWSKDSASPLPFWLGSSTPSSRRMKSYRKPSKSIMGTSPEVS